MSRIQLSPVCVYWWNDEHRDHDLFFHADHDHYSFEEFCFRIILPHLKTLQEQGYNVRWGHVNDGNQTIDEYESTLLSLMGRHPYESQGWCDFDPDCGRPAFDDEMEYDDRQARELTDWD